MDFKLSSQKVETVRHEGESDDSFFLRHERLRRITSDGELLQALALLDSIDRGDILEKDQIANFLRPFNQ